MYFNERKATQIAAQFLRRAEGQMSYLKLIKLMYLAERQALAEIGRPMTGDEYFAMNSGPVLSKTYDLISEGPRPGETTLWEQCISEPAHYDVSLQAECGTDELSPAEEQIIDEIFDQYGDMEKWQLVEYLHDVLPEWDDPDGSSHEITYRDILEAVGKDDDEIQQTEDDLVGLRRAQRAFG